MELKDYLRVLRERWLIVLIALAIAIAGSLLATATAERQYASSAKLFISVASSGTPAETYQGSMFAQSRIVPYIELIKGERVAQETVKALKLDMTAAELRSKIDAKSEAQSIVIDVTVTDSSAQRAADIANEVCQQFNRIAREAETPVDGGGPTSSIKIVEEATPSDAPVSPNGSRNLALGALVGLLVGLGAAIAVDRWRGPKDRSSAAVDSGFDDDADVIDPDGGHHEFGGTRVDGDTDDFSWLPPSARHRARGR